MSSKIAQLPSSVVSQFASAIPKIDDDIAGYVSTLIQGPSFASAVSKLNPILPNDAKSQLAGDPVDFVLDIIVATTPPAWATAVPLDLAGYLQGVGEDVASIISNGVANPPLPHPTMEPRPGSSRPSFVPSSSSTVVATSTGKVATSSAYTVTTPPVGTGGFHSSGSGGASGAGTGTNTVRVVTPTSPPSPNVTPFNSASRWSGMIGAVAALMAVGVGALLLA